MGEIKIILLCSGRFALETIKELTFLRLLVVVAVPKESDEMIENLQAVLSGTGIPVLILDEKRFASQLEEAIKNNQINLGLVLTFPYKIPPSVYNAPGHGFFNIHPGPLPQYRGADPVFQQIKNREKFAAVTIHKLENNMDKGPVVIMEMIPLEITDTHGTLNAKLAKLASKLCQVLIRLMGFGITPPLKQQDEGLAHYYKKQLARDIIIDWEKMDAASIIALAHACNPWNKGAVTKINDRIIRILVAEKFPADPHTIKKAGTILRIDHTGFKVLAKNGEVVLVKIIYADEGYMLGGDITQLGVKEGDGFVPV